MILALVIATSLIIQLAASGKTITLAQNYDGTNHFTCAWYAAGNYFDAYRSVAAKFHVAGNGKLALKRMVLPYQNSLLQADPKNYSLSIVQDHVYWPVGEVVWTGHPEVAALTTDNYDHPLYGMVEGGKDYWVTFEPTALDNRYFAWSFATAPIPNCGPMFPQDSDWVAFRASSSGPSTDMWVIRSAQIRPAFLIEGDPLPKAEIRISPLLQIPGNTNLLVISADNARAQVVLDGSESSDPDNDPMGFVWFDGQFAIATSVESRVCLEIGRHAITLVVGDGVGKDTRTISLDVIAPSQAVQMLSSVLGQLQLPQQETVQLQRMLLQAQASFDNNKFTAGVNQIRAFQNIVRVRLMRDYSESASLLVNISQAIASAFTGS